ncbi:hypothetical protein ALC53_10264 [Atta colombica]|uniref:Uncharacterized protein n=1 Tax=Atta colombica TaxID=520822 RepID=A0A151I0C9_9HYME|nr:hypothetical protein ALC53_10264 [Atta colombica]
MPVIVFGVSPRRLYCELRDYRVFITLNDLSQARAAQLGSKSISLLNTAYLGMPVTPSRSAEFHANTWNHNDGTARAKGAFEETVIPYSAKKRHAHLCLTSLISMHIGESRAVNRARSAAGQPPPLGCSSGFWVMCVSTRNGDYRDGSPFQRIIWYFLILFY